jgi:hypothetical protein
LEVKSKVLRLDSFRHSVPGMLFCLLYWQVGCGMAEKLAQFLPGRSAVDLTGTLLCQRRERRHNLRKKRTRREPLRQLKISFAMAMLRPISSSAISEWELSHSAATVGRFAAWCALHHGPVAWKGDHKSVSVFWFSRSAKCGIVIYGFSFCWARGCTFVDAAGMRWQ